MNPCTPPHALVKARREALIQAAREEQRRKEAGTARSRIQSRLLAYAGDLLHRLMNKLKNREPIHPSPLDITPHF